ncbi:FMO-like domain-containing protein [Cephalotus follicularis]|uniref:Flavin-containing monooxygenase n=1 Tax=Cephalotus follicularis TaxID=3775 RepID=A0A1Q3AWL6_CEPFO|nr:FMO-like domain-containing protein [Cephalotus follicularis]
MEKKVGIIGAGISGLLAYFPWPDSVTEEFPNQHQVLDYVHSYATHFDLIKHIKFNTKVVGIDFEGSSNQETQSCSIWDGNGEPFSSRGKWKVQVEDTQSYSSKTYQVDFVILCVGRFSDVPNIPEFPPNKGPEAFHGKVIHSMDYAAKDYVSAVEYVKGKRVVVVGLLKSALDIAMECSIANGVENPCTVLYKTAHWNVLDYLPWGLPLGYLYLNRFSELLVHKPGEGFLLSLVATMLSPVRWAFSKFVETGIKRKLPLRKYGMVPNHSFHQEINACLISTVPKNFYDKVEEGSIKLKKSLSFSFCKEGVMVEGDDAPLETDLVILATGFRGDKKLKDILVSQTFKDNMVGSHNAIVPLYRGCIPPRIPQLAVIGFSESLANLYTSEIRCRWLAELLDGTFKLPSIKEMEKEVSKWDAYMKQYCGPYYRRSCIGALHIWYNDQLCKDMGWNPRRKKGLLAELFQPYGPMDYVSP